MTARHIPQTFFAAVGLVVTSISAQGQVIRGIVRDEATSAPVKLATVGLLDSHDSTVLVSISNDSGKFLLRLAGAGKFSLDIRHIGYARLTTEPFAVAATDTIVLTLDIAMLPKALDTVVTKETRGVFSMTSGQEFVREHFIAGKGLIISGWTIEKSGKSLSEYLGSLNGLHLSGTFAPGTPVIPAAKGEFLESDRASQCLYGRIDRYSIFYMLMQQSAESIDDLIKVKDIIAVEVYRDHREIPSEWGQEGFVTELFTRLNNGHTYTIGHTGFPAIFRPRSISINDTTNNNIVTEDSLRGFATAVADTNATSIPPCGFMQIWTRAAW